MARNLGVARLLRAAPGAVGLVGRQGCRRVSPALPADGERTAWPERGVGVPWTGPGSVVARHAFATAIDSHQEEQTAADEDPKDAPGDVRAALLDAALAHVPQMGWTDGALRAAAQELGLSPASAGLLTRGPVELVEHHVKQKNAELIQQISEKKEEFLDMPMHTRIFTALKMRLEMNAPHIGSWPQALALMGHPANSPQALSILADLVDDIWHLVGDRSVDTSWYTKRALLAGIYVSTDLYMLTDTSPGFQDTWDSLDRRLKDVQAAGGALKDVNRLAEQMLKTFGIGPQEWQQAEEAFRRHADAAAPPGEARSTSSTGGETSAGQARPGSSSGDTTDTNPNKSSNKD